REVYDAYGAKLAKRHRPDLGVIRQIADQEDHRDCESAQHHLLVPDDLAATHQSMPPDQQHRGGRVQPGIHRRQIANSDQDRSRASAWTPAISFGMLSASDVS